jgi:ABC-type multidrug transport system ATPase subunit
VAVIKNGRLVAEGKVSDLVGQNASVKVRVDSTRRAAQLLEEIPGCRNIRANGEYVTLTGVSSQTVVAHLASNGVVPSEISNGHLDLESIFLELTRQELKEV